MPEVTIERGGKVSNRGTFNMGCVSKAVAHVLGIVMDTKDRDGCPVRGVDTVGPPLRVKQFGDHMEDETFFSILTSGHS